MVAHHLDDEAADRRTAAGVDPLALVQFGVPGALQRRQHRVVVAAIASAARAPSGNSPAA